MKKIFAILTVLLLLLVIFGCSKEPERKLVSRPIQAKSLDSGSQSSVQTQTSNSNSDVADTDVVVQSSSQKSSQERSVSFSDVANCEQVTVSALSEKLGGSWAKTADCPQRPQMPSGVSVCQCSYDGPGQVYVNVEVQNYDDDSQARRVYGMYCSDELEESSLGADSCILPKTSSTSPNYLFFYTASHFVKVSCLGGSCPFSSLGEVAEIIKENI